MKNIFGVVAVIALVAGNEATAAQQTKQIFRIGYLSGAHPTSDSERSQGIKLALHELGYREGENIAFDFRYAEEKLDRLPELAAELVRLHVDIIVAAGGGPVIHSPIRATKTIPIVMAGQGAYPVEAGFVKSLAQPGGNVTGVTNLLVQLGDKRLELLKEAVPKIVPYRGSVRSGKSNPFTRTERGAERSPRARRDRADI